MSARSFLVVLELREVKVVEVIRATRITFSRITSTKTRISSAKVNRTRISSAEVNKPKTSAPVTTRATRPCMMPTRHVVVAVVAAVVEVHSSLITSAKTKSRPIPQAPLSTILPASS